VLSKALLNVILLPVMRNPAIDPIGIIFSIAMPHLPISCHPMYTYSFLPDTLTAVWKRGKRNTHLPSIHQIQHKLIYFQKNSRVHPLWPQKECRYFGRVENRTRWQETKIQIKLADMWQEWTATGCQK